MKQLKAASEGVVWGRHPATFRIYLEIYLFCNKSHVIQPREKNSNFASAKIQPRMCHCRVIDQPLQIPVPPIRFTSSHRGKRLKIGIQSPPCHVHHVDTSWAPTANATHGMRQQISRNAFDHCMVKVFNGKTWWLASYPAILRQGMIM